MNTINCEICNEPILAGINHIILHFFEKHESVYNKLFFKQWSH